MLTKLTSPLKPMWVKFVAKYGRTVIVCAFVVLVALFPVLFWQVQHAREKAWRCLDGSQLRAIGCALHMFAADHNGFLPDDFGELYEGKYLDADRIYVSPGSATKLPANAVELRAGQCDYVYLGAGLKMELRSMSDDGVKPADPWTVIAYTKPGILGPWMSVLFPDGHTECVKASGIAEAAAQHTWILPPAKPAGYKTPLALRCGKRENGRLTVDLTSVTDVTDAQFATLPQSPNIRGFRFCGKRVSDARVAIIGGIDGLEELDLSGNPLTEEGLVHLIRLPHLRTLRLGDVHLTDSGVNCLAAMSSLEVLDVSGTAIDDSDLERLLPLVRLTELGLYNTRITDDGLKVLEGFKQLKRLDLGYTKVTEAGRTRLRAALPGLQISDTQCPPR